MITLNFHFAYRSSNLVWTTVKVSIEAYLDYWLSKTSSLGQVSKQDFEKYCLEIEKAGLISESDWVKLTDKILTTKIPKLNVCLGVNLTYTWSKDEAINVDDSKKLNKVIREDFFVQGRW